jgi:hypothetical protein
VLAVSVRKILASVFPILPTSTCLIGMDASDVAQLQYRIRRVREIRASLEDDMDLNDHDSGAGRLWFMKRRSANGLEGLDISEYGDETKVRHFSQSGTRAFTLSMPSMQEQHGLGLDNADQVLKAILTVFDRVISLPNGGLDRNSDEVVEAAKRAASVVGALHVANGLAHAGTVSYAPRTPWRRADAMRGSESGGRSFLKKAFAERVFKNDPVTVSLSLSDDEYRIRGLPQKHLHNAPVTDPIETMRIISDAGLADMAGDAITGGRKS